MTVNTKRYDLKPFVSFLITLKSGELKSRLPLTTAQRIIYLNNVQYVCF